MKKRNQFLWVGLSALILMACSDDGEKIPSAEELYQKEIAKIREFLKDKDYEAIPIDWEYNGKAYTDSVYVFDASADGVTPAVNDYVLMNYDRTTFDGYYLDSSDPVRIVGEGLTPTFMMGGPVYKYMRGKTDGIEDLEGLVLSRIAEGKKGKVIMSSRLYGGSTYFYGTFSVKKVIKKNVFEYEKELIAGYMEERTSISESPLETIAVKTATGDTTTYVSITKRGEGDLIESSDSVKYSYTSYILLEPTLNTQLTYTKKIEEMKEADAYFLKVDGMISGMAKGFLHLRKGDEAEIVVPYGMAYGASGLRLSSGQYMISPYVTWLFKIKVLDVKKK